MGHDLPMVTARELVSVLEGLGFQVRPMVATGHRRYVHPDGRRTTVPFHAGGDIGRGLLRKILKDIDLTPDKLKELL